MPLMRLVQDDEMAEANEMDDLTPQSDAPEPVEPAEEAEAPADPPAEPVDPPAEASETPEAAEQPDGPVEDAAEAAGEAETAEGQEVNLGVLESLLFSTHHPLTPARLAELLELPSVKPLRKAIKALNQQYEESGRSFCIEQVAGGFQLLTLPSFGDWIKKLHQREGDAKLTKAALETLAIVAYKQPILRADVEAIRGVACGETIRSLMEKHLVKIAGRAEEPGRPILYGTTKRFLELFGLNSLKDLPQEDAPSGGGNQ